MDHFFILVLTGKFLEQIRVGLEVCEGKGNLSNLQGLGNIKIHVNSCRSDSLCNVRVDPWCVRVVPIKIHFTQKG